MYRKSAGYWTIENCIKDAKKYKTNVEWRLKSNNGYRAAQRNKWLTKCRKHFINSESKKNITKKSVMKLR